MNKKIILFLLAFSLFTTLIPSLATAQNLPAPYDTGITVMSFFNALLSNQAYYQFSSETIARMLVFILLFVVTLVAAKRIFHEEKKNIPVIVAFVVSLMGIRYLTPEMIQGLFLPYQALGIALSISIPVVLFESFMLTSGRDFAKPIKALFYYVFLGIFVALWWTRWTDIGDLSWYYLVAAAIVLVAYLFSDSLEKWMVLNDLKSSSARGIYLEMADLEEKIQKAAHILATSREADQKRAAHQEVKELRKSMEHLMNIK